MSWRAGLTDVERQGDLRASDRVKVVTDDAPAPRGCVGVAEGYEFGMGWWVQSDDTDAYPAPELYDADQLEKLA